MMDISRNGGDIAFRTPFSSTQDLVQVLCGCAPGDPTRNNPVDFKLAGLQRKGHGDIWHVDQALAFSTDECSPFVINGEDIGGNHGHPCGVRVFAPGHGCTCRQTGTLWQDEDGLKWTLVRAEDEDSLLFLSENTGPSACDYAFAASITGALRCLDEEKELRIARQNGGVQLTPAIRHLKREAVCLCEGEWVKIGSWHTGCEMAEIREVYEVINPATVAQALRQNRPADGCALQPSLAVGEGMYLHRMTYRILKDGTILCLFDHEALQPVQMSWYLGIMHQEKCDAYGGGVWRYIPGIRPFEDHGAAYDFSRPYNTTEGPMPDWRAVTPDMWADVANPPYRQLDWIRRADGTNAAAFASGFLPVFDGAPERRAKQITDAGTLVPSRKTYPTFAGGKGHAGFERLRGVAYKQYFQPEEQNAFAYAVACDGSTWLHMDFLASSELQYTLLPDDNVTLLESSGVAWQRQGNALHAQSSRGYAVFRIDSHTQEEKRQR